VGLNYTLEKDIDGIGIFKRKSPLPDSSATF
jgi:hypothetical protein